MLDQKKQDVSHIKVFGSSISIIITEKKRYKLDIYKNWKGILIDYRQDTSKHVQAWALKIQQFLIVSDLYIEESEQGIKLLIDHLLYLSQQVITLKQKTLTSEKKL